MTTAMNKPLIIALSKGRILDDTLPLLAAADIHPLEDLKKSRKLIFDTNHDHIKLIVIRATDVPTYVEYGAADMGISGKDVLMEHGAREMVEVLDLQIARCRLMTAKVKNAKPITGRLKVASKFVNIARQYYYEQGQQVDIIKLYGGMELAPILGLAHEIVDIVDTGNTLKANGMIPDQLIANISSRLVVSRSAMKQKLSTIQPIIDRFQAALSLSSKH